MKIVSMQKVYYLSGATSQIRVNFFNKVIFKITFKQRLKLV